jgi:Uma2 family endonuclease
MATQPVHDRLVSVEEYLSMTFEHDCEYVDGVIEERASGEFEHAFLQTFLGSIFIHHRSDWSVVPLTEQRIRLAPRRFRIPDVAVIRAGLPREGVLSHPPLIVIEIQSPEDTLRRTAEKSVEYLAFGIENVWVIDPYARVAYRGTEKGLDLVRNGELTVPGSPIRIVLEDLFAELDRA